MDPIIGQLVETAFGWEMEGWALCDGRLLQVNQNPALFSLLGSNYGGDGRTTFAIPDLRPKDANGHPLPWDYHKPATQIALVGLYPIRP